MERRLRFPDPFRNMRTSVSLDGFSLHAGVRIHDRDELERLCRCAVRPPFAFDPLSRADDGRLLYRMKRPRGGSLFLLLTRRRPRCRSTASGGRQSEATTSAWMRG